MIGKRIQYTCKDCGVLAVARRNLARQVDSLCSKCYLKHKEKERDEGETLGEMFNRAVDNDYLRGT